MSEKAKILILDDEQDVRETISMALEELKFNVFSSGCKSDAIPIIKDEEIDLIIIDIAIPDGNGMEIVNEIHRIYEVPPKIIIYSGYVQILPTDPARSSVDLILEKPVPIQKLAVSVQKLIKQAKQI